MRHKHVSATNRQNAEKVQKSGLFGRRISLHR